MKNLLLSCFTRFTAIFLLNIAWIPFALASNGKSEMYGLMFIVVPVALVLFIFLLRFDNW